MNKFNEIYEKVILGEAFSSPYKFKSPKDLTKNEVFYSFKNEDGIEILVQIMDEYASSVTSEDSDYGVRTPQLMVAFGRKLKTPHGWIKVETEELLGVKDNMRILSTVFAILDDFMKEYFKKSGKDTKFSMSFHGALTDSEFDKGLGMGDSKRTRIYKKALQPIVKKHGLNINAYNDGEITITSD
jgi:hypothetical protein